ncbi:UNVERIFIED_CONTAM: hypothetical protein Slati_3723900 [Sesamum latifolium]|uniref:Endonuclease/exonuclease/phosphatase n=1 Tax=Sesamum latifolium TaxID=2727402 RepID=A0AAW2U3B5_9LAMI
MGDFNSVLDMSEVCGQSRDIRIAMEDFNQFLMDTTLINLLMQGSLFTWYNCSDDNRSLWKLLDRMLVNGRWLDRWPNVAYTRVPPRTSDHSPLVLCGNLCMSHGNIFRFDNYLAASPDFIPLVYNVWRHNIIGTAMYAVTRKLKALKQDARHDSLLLCLEHCCRIMYLKEVKLEQIMLQQ